MAKRRDFDPNIISELVDIRIKEQVPWKELPQRYMELLPEDSDEGEPDWRTLQKSLLSDVGAYAMPTRVHKKMRAKLAAEFEKADLGAMLMHILMAKYGEWNTLKYKMLMNAATAGMRDDDEEKINTPRFSASDRERMDKLSDDMTSMLFRMSDIMRTVNISDNSLFQLMEDVDGDAPKLTPYGTQQLSGDVDITEITKKMIQDVSDKTTSMMDSIQEKHKTMGIGKYRPIPEEEIDLLEIDQ